MDATTDVISTTNQTETQCEIQCEDPVYPLSSKWVLWYHAVDDPNWTLEGYTKLPAISTLEEYHGMMNSLPDISAGMFFLMKEGIPPLWEDPANKKGGYWSFRIQKLDCNTVWSELTAALIGESLTTRPAYMSYINGVSFSPKITNAIVRIWLSDNRKNNIKTMIVDDIPGLSISDAQFNRYN